MPQLVLSPRSPFDFFLTAAIFSTGAPDIRLFRDGIFRQVLDTGSGLVLAEVRSRGTPEEPSLILRLRSDRRISRPEAGRAAEQIGTLFSIHDDLTPFYRAVAGDPVLSVLSARLRGLRAPVTPTVFEALADSIIEQQISLAAARSIGHRLIRTVGKRLVIDGTDYYGYPDPAILAATPESTFRSCGLTLRKSEYLRDVSRLILSGDLDVEGLRGYRDTERVIDVLTRIRGIGRWTAELTILRGLHLPDAFPADDVGVRRFIAKFYRPGTKISADEARVFSERWGAWKGFAAYYLEVADHLGIGPE